MVFFLCICQKNVYELRYVIVSKVCPHVEVDPMINDNLNLNHCYTLYIWKATISSYGTIF